MRDLFGTNQNQAYWAERLQKEAVARATWNLRYGHKYLKEGRAREQHPRAPGRTALSVDPVSATGFSVSTGVQISQLETQGNQGDRACQAKDVAIQNKPEALDMRKPPRDTLKLLYQGISHDGQGRAQYLQERHQQSPREKFPYPILSSWEYGWHLGDIMKNYRTPAYARVQPISKVFYTKNSIFHIPRRKDQLM
uniref:Predicted gene 45521 n=1 Tax=Jaculus jaculus TaxID=51337 RepID=A0A8C5L2H9_JACJA